MISFTSTSYSQHYSIGDDPLEDEVVEHTGEKKRVNVDVDMDLTGGALNFLDMTSFDSLFSPTPTTANNNPSTSSHTSSSLLSSPLPANDLIDFSTIGLPETEVSPQGVSENSLSSFASSMWYPGTTQADVAGVGVGVGGQTGDGCDMTMMYSPMLFSPGSPSSVPDSVAVTTTSASIPVSTTESTTKTGDCNMNEVYYSLSHSNGPKSKSSVSHNYPDDDDDDNEYDNENSGGNDDDEQVEVAAGFQISPILRRNRQMRLLGIGHRTIPPFRRRVAFLPPIPLETAKSIQLKKQRKEKEEKQVRFFTNVIRHEYKSY